MFAKLRKKIEEGGAPLSEAENTPPAPGLASPIKTYGASPLKSRDSMVDLEGASASSEISEVKSTTSKEDLLKKLLKKNDQIKKLEGKITDLAAMIKERNKNIERLETALEKQKSDFEKQIQDLDAKYQRERSRHSSDSSLPSVAEKPSTNQKEAEQERANQLEASRKRVQELEAEIQNLMSQIGSMANTNESLEESLSTAQLKQAQQESLTEEVELKLNEAQEKAMRDLSQCEERLSQSRERVRVLEQRLEQSSLSGDEQLSAVRKERADLEEKLQEVREQLKHARTAASERSAQLLQQVTQLNTCLSQERAARAQQESRTCVLNDQHQAAMKSVNKEMADLRAQLEDRDLQLQNTVGEKQQAFEDERRHWADKERSLSASISQLTKQLEEAENTKQLETASAKQKLTLAVEAERVRVSRDRDKQSQDLTQLQKDYKVLAKEKDELLVRNATLSQEHGTYKRKALSLAEDGRAEIQHKNHAIAGLESVLQEMQTELDAARKKIADLERAQTVAIDDVESAEVNRLKALLVTQEETINERNRTIKKQQQRLADLKKTLQRELNIQTLPNDEALDSSGGGGVVGRRDSSPVAGLPGSVNGYGHGLGRNGPGATFNRGVNGGSGVRDSDGELGAAVNFQRATGGGYTSAPLATNYDSDVSDLNNYIAARARGPVATRTATGNKLGKMRSGRTGCLEYQTDLNFDYLRHVVLKFMLSRESEAIHLIKAVAMLLDFTKDEQKLLRDTLEYKMSWFGTRPKLGEGQFSKYVPPTI